MLLNDEDTAWVLTETGCMGSSFSLEVFPFLEGFLLDMQDARCCFAH